MFNVYFRVDQSLFSHIRNISLTNVTCPKHLKLKRHVWNNEHVLFNYFMWLLFVIYIMDNSWCILNKTCWSSCQFWPSKTKYDQSIERVVLSTIVLILFISINTSIKEYIFGLKILISNILIFIDFFLYFHHHLNLIQGSVLTSSDFSRSQFIDLLLDINKIQENGKITVYNTYYIILLVLVYYTCF
jgi:hypothetical protein